MHLTETVKKKKKKVGESYFFRDDDTCGSFLGQGNSIFRFDETLVLGTVTSRIKDLRFVSFVLQLVLLHIFHNDIPDFVHWNGTTFTEETKMKTNL